ncbi:putative Transposase, partial [Globisporangium polare]
MTRVKQTSTSSECHDSSEHAPTSPATAAAADGAQAQDAQPPVATASPPPPAATNATPPPPSGKRPRGKPIHAVWELFTSKPDAHRLASGDSALCKHCNVNVRHHNKVVSVMTHLRRCQAFVRVVETQMRDAEVPEWFAAKRLRYNKRGSKKESPSPSTSTISKSGSTATANAAPVVHVQSSADAGEYTIVPIPEKKVKLLVSHANPLDFKTLSVKILEPSPIKSTPPVVKSSIADLLACSPFVSVVAAFGDSFVSYYAAAVGATPLLLEAAKEAIADGDSHVEDSQRIVQDLARVMGLFDSRTLCGAVTSSNSPAHQNARKLLKQTFPTRFFHGCASNSLQLLVERIFGALAQPREPYKQPGQVVNATNSSRDAFLSSFTDSCRRVVEFFLESEDRVLATAKVLFDYQEDNHVTKLKPVDSSYTTNSSSGLTAFFKALRANGDILAQIVSESLFISSRSADAKAHTLTIRSIVNDKKFAASLDKAVAILEPISALEDKLRSPGTAAASDVYQGFTALPELLSAIPALTPKEKSHVVVMCRTCFDAMAGDAHALANLLDPRFLGDGMSRDAQAAVEDLLFNFPSGESAATDNDEEEAREARQEAIYTQYTEFRVASLAERTKNSFRFKMLLKGRKSALQFWQSDATFWPELQAIALRVFSMAVSSAPTAESVTATL